MSVKAEHTKNPAVKIRDKALELGFDSCGIIKVNAVEDYAERLEERIKIFPELRPIYQNMLFRYVHPQKIYDWAKSIIVCVHWYGKYRVPEGVDGLIGKYYLYDYKLQSYSREFVYTALFESFLKEMGIKIARETHGVTAARWAALKAGLGTIRKNNFFYNRHGSWIYIETWVTDQEMEYLEKEVLPACPENCTRCIDACPTGALAGPYATNMLTCVSRLTWNVKDLIPEHMRSKMGKWLYGCDICQDVCPMNKKKWERKEDYPNLNELINYIGLEKIFEMDEITFLNCIQPRFWLIGRNKGWLWKCNAVRAMANSCDAKYNEYIKKALNDSDKNVRNMAAWACEKLGL